MIIIQYKIQTFEKICDVNHSNNFPTITEVIYEIIPANSEINFPCFYFKNNHQRQIFCTQFIYVNLGIFQIPANRNDTS